MSQFNLIASREKSIKFWIYGKFMYGLEGPCSRCCIRVAKLYKTMLSVAGSIPGRSHLFVMEICLAVGRYAKKEKVHGPQCVFKIVPLLLLEFTYDFFHLY